MPFSGPSDQNLPAHVQKLSEGKRAQWIAVFNDTLEGCTGDDCEAQAFRVANGVLKKIKEYTSEHELPDRTQLLHYKVFAMTCGDCGKKGKGAACSECNGPMKRNLINKTMACAGSSARCNHDSCTACATWEFSVKGNPFYYCNDHVDGAVMVFEKHKLAIGDKKQVEPGRWIEIFSVKEYEDTAIVALVPSNEIAQVIALDNEGALSPEDLHVTMAYLGNVDQLDRDETLGIVGGVAANTQPLNAKLNGVTRFTDTHKPDEHAVVLNVDAPEIEELRRVLVDTIGLEPGTHGFTPHMTLSYIPSDSEGLPEVLLPVDPIEFDSLWVFWGNERFRIPFGLGDSKSKEKDRLDKIAQRIAKEPGKVNAEQIKKDLLEPWLVSTMSTPASQQLQKVAARTFGHSEPKELKELKIDWDLLMPMGGIYNITQDALKKQGFKETQRIPIYRPWSPSESGAKGFEIGDEVRIKLNPLTSWSTNINDALTFAEFLGSPTKPAYVLKTFIPIKSIVSTPHTGFGMPGTQEVIPAGGEYEALVEARFG